MLRRRLPMVASSSAVKRISIALEHKSVNIRLIRDVNGLDGFRTDSMIKRLLLLTLVFCAACRGGSNETHYAEVEKHRQEQAAQPAPSVTASPSPSPTASASPSPGQSAD